MIPSQDLLTPAEIESLLAGVDGSRGSDGLNGIAQRDRRSKVAIASIDQACGNFTESFDRQLQRRLACNTRTRFDGIAVEAHGSYVSALASSTRFLVGHFVDLGLHGAVRLSAEFLFAFADGFYGGAGAQSRALAGREPSDSELRCARKLIEPLCDSWEQACLPLGKFVIARESVALCRKLDDLATTGDLIVTRFLVELPLATARMECVVPRQILSRNRGAG